MMHRVITVILRSLDRSTRSLRAQGKCRVHRRRRPCGQPADECPDAGHTPQDAAVRRLELPRISSILTRSNLRASLDSNFHGSTPNRA